MKKHSEESKGTSFNDNYGLFHWFKARANLHDVKVSGEAASESADNNRRGKTRDLVRKIENISVTFWPKIGPIKDRNDIDLVNAEEIKKRWKGYMEQLYKKDLNKLDYYDG